MRDKLEKRLADAAKFLDASDFESLVALAESLAEQRLQDLPKLRLVVGGKPSARSLLSGTG